jgi:hypothetical protein
VVDGDGHRSCPDVGNRGDDGVRRLVDDGDAVATGVGDVYLSSPWSTAIPIGSDPTVLVAVTELLASSMTETLPEPELAT